MFIDIQALRKEYEVGGGLFGGASQSLVAVNDVTLSIRKGETLGLVGESGCGKTTLARCLLRLIDPTAGKIRFDGQDLFALPSPELRRLRQRMQIVFQDPFASLNPRMTVKKIVGDPLFIHRKARGKKDWIERVAAALESVGLRADDMNRYPHQFSGGQRQRVGIARALILDPDFIVLDEPVSALDVSIQAQIVNLLSDLQVRRGLTYLFVAHDLAVIQQISTRVAVMYLGRIVELGSSEDLYNTPAHPYTRLLLQSVPVPDPSRRGRRRLNESTEPPSALCLPTGCAFHPRCPYVIDRCRNEIPPLRSLDTGRFCACHRAEEVRLDFLNRPSVS